MTKTRNFLLQVECTKRWLSDCKLKIIAFALSVEHMLSNKIKDCVTTLWLVETFSHNKEMFKSFNRSIEKV